MPAGGGQGQALLACCLFGSKVCLSATDLRHRTRGTSCSTQRPYALLRGSVAARRARGAARSQRTFFLILAADSLKAGLRGIFRPAHRGAGRQAGMQVGRRATSARAGTKGGLGQSRPPAAPAAASLFRRSACCAAQRSRSTFQRAAMARRRQVGRVRGIRRDVGKEGA